MKSKVTDRDQIISIFKDGMTLAIGGQAGHALPNRLIECVLESGARHLTVYSIDSGDDDYGIGRLIHAGRVDHMITTHIGTNREAAAQYAAGTLTIEFAAMGSFIERIRCGGMGLGGVLTKTGFGTICQEGKQIITVKGEKYLLEEALRADVSITRARRADPIGNLTYRGVGHASHPVIATCGDISLVECDHLCDLGEIGVDQVELPGIYVDMILA